MIKVTLTKRILNDIVGIEQNRYKASFIKLPERRLQQLRVQAKKKSSYASTKIEGNPLSEKQVDEVIEQDEHKHFVTFSVIELPSMERRFCAR